MAGIAGVAAPQRQEMVGRLLDRMAHRGPAGTRIEEVEGATFGVAWNRAEMDAERTLIAAQMARDGGGTRCAEARVSGGSVHLSRDRAGVAPLYYGFTDEGVLCFASEVKALLALTADVNELLPGWELESGEQRRRVQSRPLGPLHDAPPDIASGLRQRLEKAVVDAIQDGEIGSWLSGGLDSSLLAALARPHVDVLHSFAAGLPGAEDLEYASQVARHIGADHHEVIVTFEEILAALPSVIRALESFDAWLVRSTVLNYFVGRAAAATVPAVLSGEGGDELFAGYSYMKEMPLAGLPAELLAAYGRLHNTALQRVDRSAAAHGLLAHVPFLHEDVVDYAARIPAGLKLHDGVEKWILREVVQDILPDSVRDRPKAKFWEGSGVQDLLASHAEETVTDRDFERQRRLPNGWDLRSKEELLYYRHFREQLGELRSLDWMGRTPER